MSKPAPECVAKARILIVDDHPSVRDGVLPLINRQVDMTCCGEAGTAAAAQQVIARLKPDLVLLDLRLGTGDGLELIKSLHSLFDSLKILVLSQLDEATFAERVLRAGARGYVMKEQASEELLGAVRTVLAGEVYASRAVAGRMLGKIVKGGANALRHGVELLTDRELQVLQRLGSGLSRRAIAAELGLSLKTVETHRENIKRKLGLSTAQELLRFATLWSAQAVSIPVPPTPTLPLGPEGI